jgi:hypothetical protein
MITGILFVLQAVVVAEAGLWLFDRLRASAKLTLSNEVTGILFGAISLVYSLILAFVIVAVWEDYNDTKRTIQAETDQLNAIVAHTSTLPDRLRNEFGKAMYAYCDQVVREEWRMEPVESDDASAIPTLRQKLLTAAPDGRIQERVFDAVDQELSSVTDLRRQRLGHTHSQIPSLIWQILVAGTVLVVVFSYFLHVPSPWLKKIYLGFLVTSLSMCMYLVYTLDRPFDGNNGISCEPYLKLEKEIRNYLPASAVKLP